MACPISPTSGNYNNFLRNVLRQLFKSLNWALLTNFPKNIHPPKKKVKEKRRVSKTSAEIPLPP